MLEAIRSMGELKKEIARKTALEANDGDSRTRLKCYVQNQGDIEEDDIAK